MRLPDLAEDWIRTATCAGARGDVAGVGAALVGAYGHPDRHYHDLRHLAEVLARVDELAAAHPEADRVAVRLAAWFHDAVYGGSADDEQRSAELAVRRLAQLRVDPALGAEVARLVRCTATHAPSTDDVSAAVLCDADLAVLAADPQRYGEYAAGVRAEFTRCDDAVFAAGRADVLRRLLARPALYTTAYAREHWEAPARHNVSTELELLSAGGAAPRRGAS